MSWLTVKLESVPQLLGIDFTGKQSLLLEVHLVSVRITSQLEFCIMQGGDLIMLYYAVLQRFAGLLWEPHMQYSY
jgi:hypothetical protein